MRHFARGPVSALAALLLTVSGCSSAKKTSSAEVLLNERMAAVLLRDGRAVEAERAYREVLPHDSRNAEIHDGLGVALLLQGRYKESYSSFDRAVDLDSEKPLYRIHRGMASLELGRFKEADADFDKAESSPAPEDRLDAAINRGRLKQRQKDFAAAEEAFSTALSRDPKSSAALIGRGIARESSGSMERAAADYLEAVRIDPKNAEATLRLGLALVMLKKTALGRRYLERTIELDPTGETGARARLLLEGNPGSSAPRS
ncbi:MAG TPA: tetratricopeptide repeat protein [Thermoanaerobaculia bacterium]|nr:tetratricopeptide repeat protein [Thermoanaerobaculia bacterium]